MKKRIIFDLDGTVVDIMDFAPSVIATFERFQIPYTMEDIKRYCYIMAHYEEYAENYTIDKYFEIIKNYTNLPITREFIEYYINHGENLVIDSRTSIIDTLEYLKPKYDLVILTNYFTHTQARRLETLDMLKYFSYVLGGEEYIKPHPKAYLNAIKPYSIEECLMVGDNYQKDYLGAKNIGLDAILISSDKTDAENQIKDLQELKLIL